jgi:hypothetical protein
LSDHRLQESAVHHQPLCNKKRGIALRVGVQTVKMLRS